MTLLEQYEEFSKLNDKKLVFFGTGSLAVRMFDQIQVCAENVSYFVDNDNSKWGSNFFFKDGGNFFFKTVYSPSKLIEDNNDIVVIITSSFINEISSQLQEMNIKHVYPYSIFFVANHDYSHKQPEKKEGKPILTVLCPTYNHERWIAAALEGFVKQETEYNFEVIVADDASTDYTTEIIRAYAKKYPDIIKTKINPINLGVYESCQKVILNIKSKYWIVCEGDDYWCNNSFIQNGITMLENNPDCIWSSINQVEQRRMNMWAFYKINLLFDYKYDSWCTEQGLFKKKYLKHFKRIFGKRLGWWLYMKAKGIKYAEIQWYTTGI